LIDINTFNIILINNKIINNDMINSFSHLKKNDIIFDIINAFNNVKKNNFFKLLEQNKNFYNTYFAHEISNQDIKVPEWKENFNDLEINIIYEKITQIINLSIKNSNKIKRDHEIFRLKKIILKN